MMLKVEVKQGLDKDAPLCLKKLRRFCTFSFSEEP